MDFLPASDSERILWIILIAIVAGYLAGAWLNRKRSKALGMWLQEGLPALGGRPTWRWIRSMTSGAEITVTAPDSPFRQAQVSYFLMTRELAPLWAIEHLRGKRDLMSVRGELRSQPGRELELVPLVGDLRRELDAQAGTAPWVWRELPNGLGLASHGEPEARVAGAAEEFARRYGTYIRRLSVRGRHPNVICFADLTGLERVPFRDFLGDLRRVLATAARA